MKKIKLTRGYYTTVDDKWFDYLNQWKWTAHKDRKDNYAIRSENGKSIRMHNVIMGVLSTEKLVDHIDRNGLNNQERNLRITSISENCKNRRDKNLNNTSGYRNVSWIGNCWRVQLQIGGKNHVFPEKFTDVDEAGAFAEKMRRKYYGEFAGKSE